MSRSILIASASLFLAGPALAFGSPPADEGKTATVASAAPVSEGTATPAKPAKDPNRMICRREKEIGSRLSTKRTCMTAQEWEAQRQTQAQEVDKIQKARPLNGE